MSQIEQDQIAGPAPGRPWRNDAFRVLWTSQTISLLGGQLSTVALPLVASLSLSATALQMGLLLACTRAPYLVIGLPAGAIIDRIPKKPTFVISAIGQGIFLGFIPALSILGVLRIPHLYLIALAVGTLSVFSDISALSLIPSVLPRRDLVVGQGFLEASASTAQVVGPGASGWLVQLIGAPLAVFADATSFVVSGFMMLFLRTSPTTGEDGRNVGLVGRMKKGLGVVFGDRVLRIVTLSTAGEVFALSSFQAVLLIYLPRDLGAPPGVIGLVLAVGSAGGLAGAVLAARWSGRIGLTAFLTGSLVLAGVAMSSLAFQAGAGTFLGAVPVVVSLSLVWFFVQSYNVRQVPLRYLRSDPSVHGRVNATIRTVVWGSAPLGALFGGVVGQWSSVRHSVLVSGLLMILAAAIPLVGRLDERAPV